MAAVLTESGFKKDMRGDAVVEAAILFPIIIMIFAGLVLLAMYLPTRSVLQQATQYAATVIATEQSDTWQDFNTSAMQFGPPGDLDNVYAALFHTLSGENHKTQPDDAETIVSTLESRGVLNHPPERLTVECQVVNYVIYKEIVVTATRTIPSPVNLSFVGFPREIPITVTSVAVVQNGDEFVRNLDLAADLVKYLADKYNVDIKGFFSKFDKIWEMFGV